MYTGMNMALNFSLETASDTGGAEPHKVVIYQLVMRLDDAKQIGLDDWIPNGAGKQNRVFRGANGVAERLEGVLVSMIKEPFFIEKYGYDAFLYLVKLEAECSKHPAARVVITMQGRGLK